ncbi:MAG: serine/threonine-protein phosphatase [Acidimicrobiia bacterium]|nr:serine/threonine-protein phosphatase [Acidimicrobiia bacterium]
MIDSDFVGRLHRALDAAPPYAIPGVVASTLEEAVGATDVALLLVDYSERMLERVPAGAAGNYAGSIPVEGTPAGKAFVGEEPRASVGVEANDGYHLYVLVSVRAERLGVLDVLLPETPSPEQRDALERAAGVIGYVVATARRYTDLFERVRRRRDLILAAEIQWELLPVLAYDANDVAVAGALEPAYAIAGDSFDYAVEADRLQVAITDGMGHGLRAALLGSLAITCLRHARRRDRGVRAQIEEANQVLFDQFGGEQFVTGIVLEIDAHRGAVTAVNAGHPRPWLLRGDRAAEVNLYADFPLGLFPDAPYREQPFVVQPGDRMLLISDGVVEATDPGSQEFGTQRLRNLLLETRDLQPPEVVRQITTAVIEHRQQALRDDATVVCVEWRAGEHGMPTARRRDVDEGASAPDPDL